MKLNKEMFSSRRPKLEQEHLEEDVAILTITEAEVINVKDDESASGQRTSIVLSFEETGDLVLWPSSGDVTTLIDQLGDDSDTWVGKQVVVQKETRNFKGKAFKKVTIAPASEWAEYLKPKKAVVKSGKKR